MITKTSGIYAIRNIVNNKVYIGSAVNLRKRWIGQHRQMLRKNKHFNRHLQNAYNLYGEQNFAFEVLERLEKENLIIREQYWMDLKKSYDPELGYNICKFANSSLGRKLSESQKKKLSESKLGTKLSEETKLKIKNALLGENNPFYNKSHSDETKTKISIKNKGRKTTDYQKLRASEANRNKIISEPHKEKIIKSNQTRKISDETKNKMRAKKVGRKLSEETRQKMREARTKYLESKGNK